ncbi:MAG: cardiolipin synthase [Gemmatimonadetes bacterium]|nr:cardiolipin synthase [Gemmatimonadota bacterium]
MIPWRDPRFWAELFVISDWIIRVVMAGVVPFRRVPSAAMAWLLFIFAFPWVGLAAFLLIGSFRLPKARLEQIARLRERLDELARRMRRDPRARRPRLKPEFDGAVMLAEHLGHLPIVGGNGVELLPDYDGTIDRIVTDIDAATRHAHLLFYIFEDDVVGARVVDALGRAVKRGVTCRVLIDTIGTGARTLRRLLPRMRALGIEAHETLPLGIFRRKAARFDLRNHRKIVVIDGQVAYTGSQNIVESFGDDGLWNDEMVVRLEGPVVIQLQGTFAADWFLESDEMLPDEVFTEVPACGTVACQVLPSGPGFPVGNYQRLLVALIHGARRRVILTTPYFIPDEALLQALHTAVLRGTRVDLVVSENLDSRFVALAQASYYDDLLEFGVHVHRYRERFLHAKHVTIDDEICVIGSSNLDIRSFRLNNEVSVVCYDSGIASQLRAEAERTMAKATPLEAPRWAGRHWVRQAGENLARLLSPLL